MVKSLILALAISILPVRADLLKGSITEELYLGDEVIRRVEFHHHRLFSCGCSATNRIREILLIEDTKIRKRAWKDFKFMYQNLDQMGLVKLVEQKAKEVGLAL